MNFSLMDLVFLGNSIIQSALQSLFLIFYYKSARLLPAFLKLMAIFNLILLPVNSLFQPDQIMIRNIFNMAVLALSCRFIFKGLLWKTLLSGILLYELILVIGVILASSVSWILLHQPLQIWADNLQRTALMYFLMDLLIFLIGGFVLHIVSREFSRSIRENKYVFAILFSLIFCALCSFSISGRQVDSSHIWVDYTIALVLLTAINTASFSGFVLALCKASRQKAIDQIQEVYQKQVRDYLLNQEEEEKLRKLRHDLLNFIESARPAIQNPEPNPDPVPDLCSNDSSESVQPVQSVLEVSITSKKN